jgi:hypothetical protein
MGVRWADDFSNNNHPCGFKGLHAMFATSVEDYNNCMADSVHHKLIIAARQNQSPSFVKQIHFHEEPTFLLQFDSHDREKSMFDMLFTYLPHWHKFKKDNHGFPFGYVISHSVQGCLTPSSNNWLCQVLHLMNGFGQARELPWGKENTLYCYKKLYYNQLGYQRDLKHEGLIDKRTMNEFRDELFIKLDLPVPRDASSIRKADAKLGMKRSIKLTLYAEGKNVWKDLDALVSNAQQMKKYDNVSFDVIENLNNIAVAKQAYAFNVVDAIIMATGDHMANAIFSPDETYFVEVGCSSQSLTGNSHFMELVLGTHRSVTKCIDGQSADNICVSCPSEDSFTMTNESFFALIDDVVKSHDDMLSFMRDHM